jgi:hypothetical protein
MEKLISMEDFILEQVKVRRACEGHQPTADMYYFRHTYGYALFLKQKYEIWMFTPCKLVGDVWTVMERPESRENKFRQSHDEGWWNEFVEYKKEYEKAQKNCLFDINEYYDFEETSKMYIFRFPQSEEVNSIFVYKDIKQEYHTVTNLVGHQYLTLTNKALIQIGLLH